MSNSPPAYTKESIEPSYSDSKKDELPVATPVDDSKQPIFATQNYPQHFAPMPGQFVQAPNQSLQPPQNHVAQAQGIAPAKQNNLKTLNTNFSEYSKPVMACCPNCRYTGLTRIKKKNEKPRLFAGIGLVVSGCIYFLIGPIISLVCCCIPGICVLSLCHESVHLCARCGIHLGLNKRVCCCG
jgi:hypothetical protein